MPDIELVGSTVTVASTPATSMTLVVPDGVLDDDVLLAAVWKDDNVTTTPVTLAGWDQIGSDDRFTYFVRVADSEPADYTASYGPGNREAVGSISAWRNVDTADPIAAFANRIDPGESLALTLGNLRWMLIAGTEVDRGDVTLSAPAGWTMLEQGDTGGTASTNEVGGWAYKPFYGSNPGTPGDFGSTIGAVSTATHIALRPLGAATPVGWDIYPAADPNGGILATITTATKRMVRIEEDGPGYGSFTVNRHDAIATAANLAKGNVVKVRIPDVSDNYIFAFIIEEGDFTILSSDEEGDEELTFGGRGVLAILDRARMWSEAYSTGLDVNDTWTEIWRKSITNPVGSAVVGGDATYVYVINATDRKIRKIRQSDRAVVRTSPALWSGSDKYAGGLGADPADSTILWVLETPWAFGGSGNTKIRKVRISDWAILATFDLGSAVQLTAIKADSSNLWVSKYDGPDIQKRSKSDGSVVTSYSITYNGSAQTQATGISVNGTKLAYWFQGTKRALIADTSAPTTITDVIKTTGLSAFGGDWTTEGLNDYFYPVSYTADVVWKYQVTAATPRDPVDGEWRLDEGTPGAIIARLMAEWQHGSRPQQPLPDVTYGFDFTTDTDGNTWDSHPGTTEFSARVGDLGLETVLRLIPYGLTVQMSPYLQLQAYNAADFGADRTSATFAAGKVRVEAAINAAEGLRRRMDDRRVDSHMLVAGEGGRFATATDDDLGYVREGFLSTSLTDEGAMEGSGDAELARQRRDSDAQAAVIPWGDDEAAGLYMPGPAGTNGHYWVGDTIRVDTGPDDFDLEEQDRDIKAVTLEVQSNDEWKSVVDLAAVFVPIYDPTQPASAPSVGGTGTAGSTTVTTKAVVTVKDAENGESYTGSIVESSDWGVYQAGTGRVGVSLRGRSIREATDADLDAIADGEGIAWDADAEAWVPATLAHVNVRHLITGDPAFKLIAHRGDINPVDGYPQDTLPAYRQAMIRGAAGVEFGVQRDADGTFQCMHDTTVDATTNGTGAVSSKTTSQMAALVIAGGLGYDAGRHAALSLHPPTLAEALDAILPFDPIIMLAPKELTDEFLTALATYIRDAGLEERTVILGYWSGAKAAVQSVARHVLTADPDDPDIVMPPTADVVSAAYVQGYEPASMYPYFTDGDWGSDESATLTNLWTRGCRGAVTNDIPAAVAWRNEVVDGIVDAAAHIADTTDAHDASAISFSPTGSISATDVQAAIEEVASEGASGGRWEVVVAGTAPPVSVSTPSDDDWIYAWVSD